MIFPSKKIVFLTFIIFSNSLVPSVLSATTDSTSTTAATNKGTLNGGVKKNKVAPKPLRQKSQAQQAQVKQTAQANNNNPQPTTWGQRHPKMKAAAIDGGIGAAAGGATGLLTGRGFLRGAAIGAGTGAGVGVARQTQIAGKHPIATDTLTGTAAGLGLGVAAGRHRAGEAALLGGAAGLGIGLWKNRKNL